MENQIDIQTKSSPVTLEVPRDGTAYAEWRQTGKLPEATPAKPKGESAPPKESSAEGKEPKEKVAPVSETGKQDQEKQKPPLDSGGHGHPAAADRGAERLKVRLSWPSENRRREYLTFKSLRGNRNRARVRVLLDSK